MRIAPWVREQVCAYVCAHTHSQCQVQQREGMGPTGKAFMMWVPSLGAQNVGRELLDTNRPAVPENFRIPTTMEDNL